MENEINVLDELSKGACMGRDAIKCVLDKVEDKDLSEELNNQYKEYKKISSKIEKLYPKYSLDEPHKTNAINKAMTWYGIEMKTLFNSGTSKLAELLIEGTNMGIVEGRKLLNHKDVDDNIHAIIQEYVDMQESAVEKLKQFL